MGRFCGVDKYPPQHWNLSGKWCMYDGWYWLRIQTDHFTNFITSVKRSANPRTSLDVSFKREMSVLERGIYLWLALSGSLRRIGVSYRPNWHQKWGDGDRRSRFAERLFIESRWFYRVAHYSRLVILKYKMNTDYVSSKLKFNRSLFAFTVS